MDFDITTGGEPPGLTRGDGKYSPIAKHARAHPGEWLEVKDMPQSLAASIKRGQAKGFEEHPGGWYEATNRGVDPDTRQCTLWVRYNTGDKPPEEKGSDA